MVDIEKVRTIVHSLPKDNICLARKMFELLHMVAESSLFNKMTPTNLAVTNGPNLLFRLVPPTDGRTAVEMMDVNRVVEEMIANFDFVFLKVAS